MTDKLEMENCTFTTSVNTGGSGQVLIEDLKADITRLDARWDYIKTDPVGARALLLLLINGKGSSEDFDTVIDRIIESRAIDNRSKSE